MDRTRLSTAPATRAASRPSEGIPGLIRGLIKVCLEPRALNARLSDARCPEADRVGRARPVDGPHAAGACEQVQDTRGETEHDRVSESGRSLNTQMSGRAGARARATRDDAC